MRRHMTLLLAGVAGFSVAVVAGIAGAKSYTLAVAKNAKVTNQSGSTKMETIVVNGHGFAVYELSGETLRHPLCSSSQCFKFWPPVKVKGAKELSKGPGVKGKLGIWHRNGFSQVTLSGRPVYTFSLDSQRDWAKGEGVVSFGGTWHAVAQSSGAGGSGGMPTGTTTTGTTTTGTTTTGTTTTGTTTTGTTTTTTTCAYPPYCY